MMTKKMWAVLALAVFSSVLAANRATAQETPTTTEKDAKKTDKAKKAEAPPTGQKTDEDKGPGKGKGRDGQAKETDKCDPPKLQKGTGDNAKKDGYMCVAVKTCVKTCNLWRSDKETNAAEFVAKEGEWKEATDGERRKYKYYCRCEDAKK